MILIALDLLSMLSCNDNRKVFMLCLCESSWWFWLYLGLEQVAELRAAIGPLSGRRLKYCTHACLRRYLEARNWNVDKAKKMLEESLKWRSTYKPEEIRWVSLIFLALSFTCLIDDAKTFVSWTCYYCNVDPCHKRFDKLMKHNVVWSSAIFLLVSNLCWPCLMVHMLFCLFS